MDKGDERVSRGELAAMLAVVLAVSIAVGFANWCNSRRDKVEHVNVTRFDLSTTPSPTPRR